MRTACSDSERDSDKTCERSSSPEDGNGRKVNKKSRSSMNRSVPGTSKKQSSASNKYAVNIIMLHVYQ